MQQNTNNAVYIPDFTDKRIGIWGYGVTGAAALTYFKTQPVRNITIFDETPLDSTQYPELYTHNVHIMPPHSNRILFFENNDYILKSPGIPLKGLPQHYKAKIISEYNLFCSIWKKPIIAITGTVGKTTITTLLAQLMRHVGKRVCTGGNIGTPMLQLPPQEPSVDYAILELSSFQIEQGIDRTPNVTVLTNIYPNHLDWHGSLDHYRATKLQLLNHATHKHKVILPTALAPYVKNTTLRPPYAWFSLKKPTQIEQQHISDEDLLYYLDDQQVISQHKQHCSIVGNIPDAKKTFIENILILIATLDQLGLQPEEPVWHSLAIPPYRLEPLICHNGITFYNDSKSTIPASTNAAIEQLHPHIPILFLGGTSKGVDRESFIRTLTGRIKIALCFGKEAEQLAMWCTRYNIVAYADTTLDASYYRYITTCATIGDHVLFSPAGASQDLFKNYIERGEYFAQLVHMTAISSINFVHLDK